MRWKLIIEYDGGGFCGWQRQNDGVITVQAAIENALAKIIGKDAPTHVAGRTDAGVHAMAQVAHVDIERPIAPHRLRDALNFHLRPHPISVVEAAMTDESFHARFSAVSREYRYFILNRPSPSAINAGRVWHIRDHIDVSLMSDGAKLLTGYHDFSTFRAAGCQATSPWRTLDLLDVEHDQDNPAVIIITARARSFLYHQVRNMVGTLIKVGTGRWNCTQLQAAFAACDRSAGGPTAPAAGLFLWQVQY